MWHSKNTVSKYIFLIIYIKYLYIQESSLIYIKNQMENNTIIFNTINIVGGILLMIGFIPQLYKSIIYKSTKDISFGWLFLSLLGLIMVDIKSIYVKDWTYYIPISIEIVFILILIIFKVYHIKKGLYVDEKNQYFNLI